VVTKSSRPKYAIVLLVLSSLWMGAIFLPLLYSVVFPDRNLRGFVDGLEARGTAPAEATTVVQETIAAVGTLTRAVPVAYYSGITTTVRLKGSESSRQKRASYIAWFEKHPKPLLIQITLYEADGHTAYSIDEGEPMVLVRGYSLPILFFGVSLFLVRRKKSSAAN
jgi:hypothetical protein